MDKLIINADDYGLTAGVSQSILDLFERQAISNTSVMVCVDGAAPSFEALKVSGYAKYAGVHLQATFGAAVRPLSDSSEIPTLVDQNENFKRA